MQIGGTGIGKSILVVLSEENNLTAKQLYMRVLRLERRSFSYQALHKKIKILEQQGILKKKNKFYSLNPAWLQNLAMFVEHAIANCTINPIKIENYSISQIHSVFKKELAENEN